MIADNGLMSKAQKYIETEPTIEEKPASFLNTAKSLKLQGPPGWSKNIDGYLYGEDEHEKDET